MKKLKGSTVLTPPTEAVVTDVSAFASFPGATFLDVMHRMRVPAGLPAPGAPENPNRPGINQKKFVEEPSPPSQLEDRDRRVVSDAFGKKLESNLALLMDEGGAEAVFQEAARMAAARGVYTSFKKPDDRDENTQQNLKDFGHVEAANSKLDHATGEERAEGTGATLPDPRKVIAALAGTENIDYADGQHPGLLLDAILRRKDVPVAKAAKQLGVARPHLYRIIGGGTDISAAVADALAKANLGSAEHWLYLQALYALDKLRSCTTGKPSRRKPSTPHC